MEGFAVPWKEPGCFGAVRVTVGTEKETDAFLKAIKTVLAKVHALDPKGQGQGTKQDKGELVEARSRSGRRHAVAKTELTGDNEGNPEFPPRGKGRGRSRIKESWWRLGPDSGGGMQSPRPS